MATPNSEHAVERRVEACAEEALQAVGVRSASKPPISTTAAMTTPIWLPMPPSTTMARMMADSMKVKLSGLMKPWRVAKKRAGEAAEHARRWRRR